MTYRTTKQSQAANDAKCPECGSTRLQYGQGKLKCTNCDHLIHAETRRNKYNATKTTFAGIKYDSMFEANVAAELDILFKSGAIKNWERQYKVGMFIYRKNGEIAHVVNHKVDFRIHHNDGSYELLEAKGVETADYKFRRMLLEKSWLPDHPDHIYTVRKQNNYFRKK